MGLLQSYSASINSSSYSLRRLQSVYAAVVARAASQILQVCVLVLGVASLLTVKLLNNVGANFTSLVDMA